MHQGGSLVRNFTIQVFASEGHAWARHRSLQASPIPKTLSATVVAKLEAMNFQDLLQGQVENQLFGQFLEGRIVFLPGSLGQGKKTVGDLSLFKESSRRADSYGASERMHGFVDGLPLFQLERLHDLRG